jgi:hypothetical protein
VVRRVIGRDDVDRSIAHRVLQRLDIVRCPQRRIHLGVGVVPLDRRFGEREVVGTHLGGDADPAFLSPPNQLDRSLRARMTDVYVAARQTGEEDVTNHHDLLGLARNPLETETGAHDPLVHRSSARQRRLLAMIGDRDPERSRVLERGAHEVRAHHRAAVVAHRDRPGPHHLAEFGQRLPLLSHRDRADRMDSRPPGALRLADDEADGRLIVGDRLGVRHRADSREAARRRRPRTGGDRLDVLAPGLTQMAVDVDEAGSDDRAGAIERQGAVGRRQAVARVADLAVRNEQIDLSVDALTRVDQPPAPQEQRPSVVRGVEGPLDARTLARHYRSPFAASASSGRPPARR